MKKSSRDRRVSKRRFRSQLKKSRQPLSDIQKRLKQEVANCRMTEADVGYELYLAFKAYRYFNGVSELQYYSGIRDRA